MRRYVLFVALLCLASCAREEPPAPVRREISHLELDAKIRGGWAAMINAAGCCRWWAWPR